MGFYERYELLELDRDDGVKTFQAREVATGRPVKVHLFPVPAAPYQAHLLKEIEELPESESARILDRGNHMGTRYVVTDRLVDHPGLFEWISASLKAAAGKAPDAIDKNVIGKNTTDKKPTDKNAADQEAVTRKVTIPSPKSPAAFSSPAGSAPPAYVARSPVPPNSAPPSPAASPRVAPQDSELNRQFADLFKTSERPVFVMPPSSEAPTRLVFESSSPSRQTPPPPAQMAPSKAMVPEEPQNRSSQSPTPQSQPSPSPALPARRTKLLVILGYTAIGVAALLITMFFMLRRR